MFRSIRCKEHDHSSFYRDLQMEKNHKNTDCYFFYYSTCKKGDSCGYRHEASALGCETVCTYWQQGSCLNQHCNFRHMEIKKNRKAIPCYWEKFPNGCKKPHCPFLHRLIRPNIPNPIDGVKAAPTQAKPVNQEWTNRPDGKFEGNSTETDQGHTSSEPGSFIGNQVDPLIVNFEEESDSESAPSPTKHMGNRTPSCKTYEEIRLEEIQAESAAFYSYGPSCSGKEKKSTLARDQRIDTFYRREELDFQVLSLDEIKKRKKEEGDFLKDAIKSLSVLNKNTEDETGMPKNFEESREKKKKKKKKDDDEFLKDAIKSLDELRYAKLKKKQEESIEESVKTLILHEFNETSMEDESNIAAHLKEEKPVERRKRRSFIEKTIIEDSPKRLRGQTGGHVPPVRLKRTRKTSISKDEEKPVKPIEVNERLLDEVDTPRGRESVEIRLCDSSTDDNLSTESLVERKTFNDNFEILSACDSVIRGNLMSVETDDDILKDIDALLDDPNS